MPSIQPRTAPAPNSGALCGRKCAGPLRAQPHAGAVVEPQPPTLGLPPWYLESFLPPDPFHPLVVHRPARHPQQRRDPPVAVPPVDLGQGDDFRPQRRLVVGHARRLALRRPVLIQHPAGKPLRDAQPCRDMLDAGPTTRGAQKLPDAASLRITFSSVRSATAWRRRAFSASSCFSRFTWSSFSPPYS